MDEYPHYQQRAYQIVAFDTLSFPYEYELHLTDGYQRRRRIQMLRKDLAPGQRFCTSNWILVSNDVHGPLYKSKPDALSVIQSDIQSDIVTFIVTFIVT